MKYELKKLSFGEMMGKSLNLYFALFLPVILIAIVASIPGLIYSYLFNTVAFQSDLGFFGTTFGTVMLSIISYTIGLIVNSFQSGMTIRLVANKYTGEKQTVGEYFKSILPKIFPIVGLSLALGILIALGLIALVVPGIIVMLMYYFSVHIMVLENKGIKASMRASKDLTDGKKGPLFGYVFFIGLLNGGITFGINAFLPNLVFSLVGMADYIIVYTIIYSLIVAIISPFFSILTILIYFNFRIEKQGFGLENLVDRYLDSFDEASTESSKNEDTPNTNNPEEETVN